ncbi:HisA/HisF-related TIM barrel protein [Synechococcus sp. AH-601-N10]|nr:HisA/HisF-related TIM barrel protein [Synechococcus sp. AH-601-N10]
MGGCHMRVCALLLLKGRSVVQSYSFSSYRFIGDPVITCNHLDKWAIDEILALQIDDDFESLVYNLSAISKVSTTPITVGGGISSLSQAKELIKLGADRLCLQNILFTDFAEVLKISDTYGGQSITISLPFDLSNKLLKPSKLPFEKFYEWFNLHNSILHKHGIADFLFVDMLADGIVAMPSFNWLDHLPLEESSVILAGGLSVANIYHVLKDHVGKYEDLSIAVGNFLYHKELPNLQLLKSIQNLTPNHRLLQT